MVKIFQRKDSTSVHRAPITKSDLKLTLVIFLYCFKGLNNPNKEVVFESITNFLEKEVDEPCVFTFFNTDTTALEFCNRFGYRYITYTENQTKDILEHANEYLVFGLYESFKDMSTLSFLKRRFFRFFII